MSLIETVMASLVFSLTAAASLHLLDLVSSSELALQKRQQQVDQLEAGLVAFESQLRSSVRQAVPTGDCNRAAGMLLLALQASAPSPGLRRDLTVVAAGEVLQLRLAVDGLGQIRQRDYHPAALGLCPTSPAQEVANASS
jgi:hypothetical protein